MISLSLVSLETEEVRPLLSRYSHIFPFVGSILGTCTLIPSCVKTEDRAVTLEGTECFIKFTCFSCPEKDLRTWH